MDTFKELTEQEFDEIKFKKNHLREYSEHEGCMFETYGEELDYILSLDRKLVCTIIEGDDGDLYVTSGFHYVNRIGYLVLEEPLDYEFETKWA